MWIIILQLFPNPTDCIDIGLKLYQFLGACLIKSRTKSGWGTGGRERESLTISCVWHPHSPHYSPYCFALLTLNTTLTRVSSKFHQILSFSQLKHLLGMALIRTRRASQLAAPGLNHNFFSFQDRPGRCGLDISCCCCSDIYNNYSYSHYFIISPQTFWPPDGHKQQQSQVGLTWSFIIYG